MEKPHQGFQLKMTSRQFRELRPHPSRQSQALVTPVAFLSVPSKTASGSFFSSYFLLMSGAEFFSAG
jgi:hypothetical protein